MKTLAFAALLFSLPVEPVIPPGPQLAHEKPAPKIDRHGRWYMADSGHAVYCIGPVVTVPAGDGGLLRVATFCQGRDPVVPLHD
jgi:hypothetical protein